LTPYGTFITLHHGTTRQRADSIVMNGPDEFFIEPHGTVYADGFSTVDASWPANYLMFRTPEEYARGKAQIFPNEGGPVILEIEVPEWIVDIVRNDPYGAVNYGSGDVRFEPGCGLEALQGEWNTLIKRIVTL
jgi:hypothetical protein